MFAHNRGPFRSRKNRTAEAATPAAHESNGGNPMDPHHTIGDGTPIGELIVRRDSERASEAAEAVDNGNRLALCMEWQLLAIADAPVTFVPGEEPEEIDDILIGRVAARVSEDRDELARQLHHLDKQALVAQHDDFLDVVREHMRGES
jgi:hypothetical protein